jgi:hypothetical protein
MAQNRKKGKHNSPSLKERRAREDTPLKQVDCILGYVCQEE